MTEHARESAGPTTRTGAIMDAIRGRIANRTLAAGERLPSIRGFAGTMRVSPSTVVEAFDRLVAEGLIRSRPGSGFYVAGSPPPTPLAEVEPRGEREVDPLWVSRQSLDAEPDMLRPGCGWLPADWMPNAAVRRAVRGLARASDGVLAYYGASRGSLALRGLLARQFATEGVDARADQILLTASGTQAIDLLCRFFLQPGDTVMVDDPCYFNFLALLRAHRVRVASVPYTPTGPDVPRFIEAVRIQRPRLYITKAAIHNPTGATVSPQTAHQILAAATAHDLTIIEDDIFAGLEPEPSPRLATLDGLWRVIRIGSFSKTLSASIRCGYVAARAEWIEALTDLQVATNFGGPSPLAAELVVGALNDGSYRKHLKGMRDRLAKRRRETIASLDPLGIRPWTCPRGGFFLWCRLPDAHDAAELARTALRDKVLLAPGNIFSVTQSATDLMRVNVAQMNPRVVEVLWAGLRRSSTRGS